MAINKEVTKRELFIKLYKKDDPSILMFMIARRHVHKLYPTGKIVINDEGQINTYMVDFEKVSKQL